MIYLASPYTHDDTRIRDARYRAICVVAGRLMREGHHVLSPIAHTHPIAMLTDLPTAWEYWERMDRAMLRMCGELWVCTMPGWEESRGVQAEIGIARRLGLPIRYVAPDTLEVGNLDPRELPTIDTCPAHAATGDGS